MACNRDSSTFFFTDRKQTIIVRSVVNYIYIYIICNTPTNLLGLHVNLGYVHDTIIVAKIWT
jgi:hypothetical protein